MQKIIAEYPNYAVDEMGIVRRICDGRVIAQQTYFGYKCVSLWKDGKQKWQKVHRLVATAFLENPDKLPFVNHKDENKGNNTVENLEWCNASYNNTYGENAPVKRMAQKRRKPVCQYDLNGALIATFKSATEAQRRTGIAQSNISKCCLNRNSFKTAGGYIWQFAN